MGDQRRYTHLAVPLLDLTADRELPGAVYLCLQHKMVRYRNKDDKIEADAFNKLVYNHVKVVFIEAQDQDVFETWIENTEKAELAENPEAQKAAENPEAEPILEAAKEQRRVMMDIFESPRDDRQVKAAIETSRKLVTEFLRKPFAINSVQALQRYGKGCVDHSVNVSVLSVFLGLRLGYSHQLILENLALGGLFHDIGKLLIESKEESMMTEEDIAAMQKHPHLGMELLDKIREVQNEVRMIVGQHHEFLDGSGYPARLKGLAIYDLARLVAIANIYDNLITESLAPTIKEKSAEAVNRLETEFEGKLDPKKLEKVIKILKFSLL